MQLRTSLLVQILDVLEYNKSEKDIIKRLYCESGQACVKVCRYVEEPTRETLNQILVKHQDCNHMKLKHTTMVMMFEELAALHEIELLRKAYQQIGKQAKVVCDRCNMQTQKIIRKNGFANERKIIKTEL